MRILIVEDDLEAAEAMARGLTEAGYECVKAPDGEALWTCTVLTTEAADELGEIHDRTPLLVPPRDWARWLDPALADPGAGLLVPGTPGVLDAWAVGTAVGNVRNDGPDLVRPLDAQAQPLL